VEGQSVPVPPGQYSRLHLAWLATDGDMADLSRMLLLNYADGTSQPVQIGPVPNWFNSPAAYADAIHTFYDRSTVKEYLNITPNVDDEDPNGDPMPFVLEISGSALQDRPDSRFMDGTSVLIYELDLPDEISRATLGIDMWNNFVVSLSKDGGWSFTQMLNSFEMFHKDVHDGSNRNIYTIDLAPWLQDNPSRTVQVRFTDDSTGDGWGPQVFKVVVYTGTVVKYQQRQNTVIDTSKATVFADFLTDGGPQEKSYLLDHSSQAPSAQGHRFADGKGFILYELKLPEGTQKAQAAMNLNGNFVVSVGPGGGEQTLVSIVPNVDDEENGVPKPFVVEITGSAREDRPDSRFMDGTSRLTYALDLPDDATQATLKIDMWNNFVVWLSKDGTTYTQVLNSQKLFGKDVHDGSNRDVYTVDLGSWLQNNPAKQIRVRFADGSTSDGWGPQVFKVTVTTSTDVETLVSIVPNVDDEEADGTPKPFVIAISGSALEDRSDSRFMDGSSVLIYELDLRDDVTEATLKIDMWNNFVVSLAKEGDADFTEVLNSEQLFGQDVHNGSNRDLYEVDLAPWLQDNPNRKIQVRFTDGSTGDGWGPQVFKVLVTRGQAAQMTEVMSAVGLTQSSLVPYSGTGGQNKGYYAINLSPFLTTANKSVRIKLTDGTPNDGWGPGIWRMVVHDGTLGIRTDGAAIAGLKPTEGLPTTAYPNGANIVRREYAVDSSKTLQSLTLPTLVESLGTKLYLMAATVESKAGGAQLQIARNPNGTVTIDWDTTGTLESAGQVTGAWTPVVPQTKPLTIPAVGTQFYRVKD
jgi:hypothetical protein